MRQMSIPATMVVALAALLLVVAPISASAQVAKVTPLSHDFGDMKQMQTERTAVTLTNAGAARLVITEVKADCGCTIPKLEVQSLAPGESTQIAIEFNSKRFDGKVHKVVHINTNDPVNSVIDVMLTANVFAPLTIKPSTQRIGFDRSLVGETATRQVVFTAKGSQDLKLTVGKTRKGLFDVKVINHLGGDPHIAALEVTRPATMKPGRHRDGVRVTTNVADVPTADIEIQAWVSDKLTATPDHVIYRFKKNLRQSIRIAPFRKGTEFKVTKVECDLPEISVKFIETTPNAETKVLLAGSPIGPEDPRAVAAKGRITGTVKVYVDNESEPAILIPVSYMVRM